MFFILCLLFILALVINNRLLMNLIVVEMIGIVFTALFMTNNVLADNLFVILVSIFILESVLGLVILLFVLEKSGSDFILSNFMYM